MARWFLAAFGNCRILVLTALIMCNTISTTAGEIPPHVGAWEYTANKCTNFSNAATWAEDCRKLDGGTWTGSNTASDPLRCENPAHPRPWPLESMIEPLASARSGGTASLQGWQSEGSVVHCTGFFDTAGLSKKIGIESTNVSLVSINENAGAWGARRDRDVECPPGSWTLSDRCLQFPAADPYRAFEMCPKNGTNPVNVFTGAKVHVETDFRGSGPNPLVLTRYYSTRTQWRRAPWEDSGFGRYWRHNYTRSLSHFKNATFEAVVLYRGNGNRHYFHPYNENDEIVWRASEPGITNELRQIEIDGFPRWEYRTIEGVREYYAIETGRLEKIELANGFVTRFEYDEFSRLSAVHNGFGRQLKFTYGEEGYSKGLIVSAALYVNDELVPTSVIGYAYEETNRSGYRVMLDKVIYPDDTPNVDTDNPVKDYLYNEKDHIYYDEEWIVDVTDGPSTRTINQPSKLTGIIDENGARFATYKYQRVLFSGGYRYALPVWGGHGAPDSSGNYANEFKITKYHSSSHRADSRSHKGYAVIKDALGTSRQFHFKLHSGVLRPTKIVGGKCEVCGDESQQTRYDDRGFVIEKIDFSGNKTVFSRDEKGMETCRIEGVSTIDPSKNAPRRIVTTWDHDYSVVLARRVFAAMASADFDICTPNNDSGWRVRHKVINTYEPNSGRLEQRMTHSYDNAGVLDELPRITRYSYYGADDIDGMPNQLKSIDGPRDDVNDVIIFRYVTAHTEHHNPGDLIEIENGLGQITRITKHDNFGRALEVIAPNGVRTITNYHPRGWIKNRSTKGRQTSFEYDKVGQLTKSILPNGEFISYGYDSAHRLTDISDSFGNSIHYELDALGNRIAERTSDPQGVLRKHVKRVMNALNQVEKRVEFSSDQQAYVRGLEYDAGGALWREIDPRNPGMSLIDDLPTSPAIFAEHTYDALHRLVATRDEEAGLTQYTYDVFDQIISIVEPSDGDSATPQGLETTYRYNSFGELVEAISPDTGLTRYTYDQAGNRLTWQSPEHRTSGDVVNYYYDALNRIQFVDYPQDEADITYGYDGDGLSPYDIGRLTSISDASGETHMSYDAWGNVTRIKTVRNGIQRVSLYTYNEANRIEAVAKPGGNTIKYIHQQTAAGVGSSQLARIELHSSTHQQILVDNISYAPFGPIESWRYNNGVQASKPLDLSYQVKSVTHDNVFQRQYVRDGVRNPIQITNPLTNHNWLIQYDGLNRLVAMTTNNYTMNVDYDALGNRRDTAINGQTTTYSYATNSHHLESTNGIAGTVFAYNLDGNVINAYGANFNYGLDGRLSEYSANEDVTHYEHNAFGQRTEKNGEYKTIYYYDLQGRLVEETDRFGNVAKTYVYMEDEPVALLEEDTSPFSDEDQDGMLNGFEMYYGLNIADPLDAATDLDADGFSNLSEHDADTDPTDSASFPTSHEHGIKQIPMLTKVAALIAAAAIMAIVLPQLNSASLVVSLVLMFSWLIAESVAAKTQFIHTDHLGTPVAMTDDSGAITWSAAYEPFGAAIVHPDSTTKMNLRFPGQYYDEESGLYYNYHRDYDPRTGRYMQSDPVGLDGGINTYSYALGNPLRFVDRFGLWVKLCARKLGDKDQPPVAPRGDLRRHDYLVISNQIRSFQRGGDNWKDIFWSRGRVDNDEYSNNPMCETICDDDKFDKYVLEASQYAPTYSVIPHFPGARNCQTWAREVIKIAKEKYLENEPCGNCFQGEGPGVFSPDFGRAL